MNDSRYLNFPVQMLSNFLTDTEQCLLNILYYSIYDDSLKRDEDSEYERFVNSGKDLGINVSRWRKNNSPLGAGRELHCKYPTNSPKTGFKFDIYVDLIKGHARKSEFEKVCFLAFLAAKSIVMFDPYKRTTNLFLLSRMDGKTHSVSNIAELSEPLQKYSNRYQLSRIKAVLLKWNVSTYSQYDRGFYISTTLNIDDLAYEVELMKANKTQSEFIGLSMKEARRKALERISKLNETP